ncbi:MAG: hypothetical protein HZB38_00150 [Planctomycetes bacterium]|nr:hypothetical protein [Planctomycetota bacterium]
MPARIAKADDVTAELIRLHSYFLWADRMRISFGHALHNPIVPGQVPIVHDFDQYQYMAHWYAGMYCVIEGWRVLKLSDPTVTALLRQKGMVDRLRKCRNAIYHFQGNVIDDRITKFISYSGSAPWIHKLTKAVGDWFLERFKVDVPAARAALKKLRERQS